MIKYINLFGLKPWRLHPFFQKLKVNIFMSTSSHALVLLSLFFSISLFAQNDPVLFTVNDQEIRLSEFSYIYNKTNGDRVKYDEASIKEYLDLYINFKLQVAEGVDMGLDKNTEVVK